VHLREGLPCPACGTAVRKLRAAGRGTYVCESCQPVPRATRRATPRPSGASGSPRGPRGRAPGSRR
jgi:formamidopyrimidine-DNA glycosylase